MNWETNGGGGWLARHACSSDLLPCVCMKHFLLRWNTSDHVTSRRTKRSLNSGRSHKHSQTPSTRCLHCLWRCQQTILPRTNRKNNNNSFNSPLWLPGICGVAATVGEESEDNRPVDSRFNSFFFPSWIVERWFLLQIWGMFFNDNLWFLFHFLFWKFLFVSCIIAQYIRKSFNSNWLYTWIYFNVFQSLLF